MKKNQTGRIGREGMDGDVEKVSVYLPFRAETFLLCRSGRRRSGRCMAQTRTSLFQRRRGGGGGSDSGGEDGHGEDFGCRRRRRCGRRDAEERSTAAMAPPPPPPRVRERD